MKKSNKKETSQSPKLKQTKISAFWCKKNSEKRKPDKEDDDVQVIQTVKKFAENRKEKEEEDVMSENTPPENLPKVTSKKPKEVLRNVENLKVEEENRGGRKIEGEKEEIENCKNFGGIEKIENLENLEKIEQKSENGETNFEDFDDVDFDDFFKSPKNFRLDFTQEKICVVLEIQANLSSELSLIVKIKDGDEKGCVKLRGVWAYIPVKIDDLVTIKAVKFSDEWVVDSKNGYVSLHPNELITTTALVGAMFCLRRGILSNFFKGFDSGNKIMIIGRLVHEMLQSSLKIANCNEDDVLKIVDDLLKETDVLRDLYSCDMTLDQVSLELKSFVPKILHFLDFYVNGKNQPEEGFRNRIVEVLDIEEDVISSKIGVKGRIDVTVRIDNGKIMPLELKTGRASFSNEHKFQVALYTMILNELGKKVESGLLFYLRDGKLEEIRPTEIETRDLILLRNQMISWLKNFKNLELPEPIRFEKACGRCPYLTICHAFLKNDEFKDLSESHPLRAIEVPEIKQNHLDYFVKWIKFCFMESDKESGDNYVLSSLTLEDGIVEFRNEYKHSFKKSEDLLVPPGSFVCIYDDKKKRVGFGKIVNCTTGSCSILLDKRLENAGSSYSLSTYSSNLLSKYLTNLGYLLDESYERLREIIIDRKESKIVTNVHKNILNDDVIRILKPLNKEQKKAVFTALATEDYCLIRGPPGTGKTQTIVALIKTLAKLKKTVLITGHTHSSVDNILSRLDDLNVLRFGSLSSVNPNHHHRCFSKLIENCTTIEDVKKLYETQIVATTCLGVDPELITKRKFDYCLVDESSQVLQPETLKPLFCCKKFVLIGDSNQLPPIVQNREAKKLKMDESLFERLEPNPGTISLRLQYRMNKVINELANKLTYKGLLECANEEISAATISLKNLYAPNWIKEILSDDIKKSVIFIDTSQFFKLNPTPSESSCSSLIEKNIILKIIETLLASKMPEEHIGIISPFRAQVELIQSHLPGKNIDVSTVDRYQGRDKEVIIYSCAKENQINKITDEFELLNDKRRLTVAVTRAKYKLIVVGDADTIKAYEPLKKLIGCMNDEGFVRLKEGEMEFSWGNLG